MTGLPRQYGSLSPLGSLLVDTPTKPRIFVSYHHGNDRDFYRALSAALVQNYSFVQDNSVDREIDSNDSQYVIRAIRENYLTGTSCTIVLCGKNTPYRKFVDWEILATLEKKHALIGLRLPNLEIIDNGCDKPARLQDNIRSGYAIWDWYENVLNNPIFLRILIAKSIATSKKLIDNSRSRRLRNG